MAGTPHRRQFILLLRYVSLRMSQCIRLQDYPHLSDVLLVSMQSLLAFHHHSLSRQDREDYLEILMAFPLPFLTAYQHIPLYIDALLSLLESSPQQQERSLRAFTRLVQTTDKSTLLSFLTEEPTKERLHKALDTIFRSAASQNLVDAAFEFIGSLGGSLRAELAAPLSVDARKDTVGALLLQFQFLSESGACVLDYGPIVEQAVLFLSHSIITPQNKDKLVPLEDLLPFVFTDMDKKSQAYCESLLLEEKQALFRVALTVVKLSINTQPLCALSLSSFPCLESDPSFHPNREDCKHFNQLRILTCCVYCLLLCCLDADLKTEAMEEVERLVDVVIAIVLQTSYQSSSVPPICSKYERNPVNKYNSDLLVELLGSQPPQTGIAMSLSSDRINVYCVVTAISVLCEQNVDEVLTLLETLLLLFIARSKSLFSNSWNAFYRMLAFYEELETSLVYFALTSSWRVHRAVLHLSYTLCAQLPREWTCRFLPHLVRLPFIALSVRLPPRG